MPVAVFRFGFHSLLFQPFLRLWIKINKPVKIVGVYVRFQPFLRFWVMAAGAAISGNFSTEFQPFLRFWIHYNDRKSVVKIYDYGFNPS